MQVITNKCSNAQQTSVIKINSRKLPTELMKSIVLMIGDNSLHVYLILKCVDYSAVVTTQSVFRQVNHPDEKTH